MPAVNYAEQYGKALAQAFPNVLHFGALYNTPNNSIYKVVDAKTIKIPVITTKGRKAGNRDTINGFTRNHDNDWELKTLTNHREWETMIHPQDVNQSNMVMSIQNATKVFNEEQKFPEMDCYTISKIHELKNGVDSGSDDNTVLTVENVLQTIDKFMEQMDEANVPAAGRILYVTPKVKTLIKNAKDIMRTIDVNGNSGVIARNVSRIDELQIETVPSTLMKTVYNFDEGAKPGHSAKQINMFMIHPWAVLTPVSYAFAQMEEPSAHSKGKYLYFEESFEDVFILNKRSKAIAFNVEA
ncbi:MAG: capsid protein [Tissierellia bacterium]|nr:capsid protein [Tissierellia bacterium]